MKKINFINTDLFAKTRVIYLISVALAIISGITYKTTLGIIMAIITLVVLITALTIDSQVFKKLKQLDNEKYYY